MKKEVSPGMFVAVLATAVVVVGALFWWSARPGRQAAEIENAISGSMIKAPAAGGHGGPGLGASTAPAAGR